MSGYTDGTAQTNSSTLISIGSKGDTRLINNSTFEFVINTIGPDDTPVWHRQVVTDIVRIPDFSGTNINNFEFRLNANGKHDIPFWLHQVSEKIDIIPSGEEWRIPISSDTNGIDMPVELAGDRFHNTLEDRDSFNTKNHNGTGLASSRPTVITISVEEDMLIGGNWRTPHTGYEILLKKFGFNTRNYEGVGLMSHKSLIVNIPVREQLVVSDHWRIPWQTAGSYKIEGLVNEAAKVLIIDENTWQVVKAQDVTPDNYSVTGLSDGKKLAVARRDSDGESLAYGNLDPEPDV